MPEQNPTPQTPTQTTPQQPQPKQAQPPVKPVPVSKGIPVGTSGTLFRFDS